MYYKVTTENNESYIAFHEQAKPMAVTYVQNEWVSAPVGYLFVFTDLQAAIEFCYREFDVVNNAGFRIWQCEIDPIIQPLTHTAARLLTTEEINHFWEFSHVLAYPRTKSLEYTAYAKKVRLTALLGTVYDTEYIPV